MIVGIDSYLFELKLKQFKNITKTFMLHFMLLPEMIERKSFSIEDQCDASNLSFWLLADHLKRVAITS